MFWTLELASYLEDAPWPATKDELIDYSIRSGAPIEVVENLQELEDEVRREAKELSIARLGDDVLFGDRLDAVGDPHQKPLRTGAIPTTCHPMLPEISAHTMFNEGARK